MCLFFSSTVSVIKELHWVFIVRESLQVPLLMFQLGSSSKNLHKIAENTDFCTEEDKYSDSNIFGRYAYNGSNDRRNSHVQRHCNLPLATFRFCFKPGEVHFESSSGNRVPWGNNKFFEDVSVFATREGVKNSKSISGYSGQRSGDFARTNKIVTSSCLNNSGSFASSDEFSISSATANKSIESNSMLSRNCITQPQFKGGTSVVDPKSPDFQSALPNSASNIFDNKDGCIQERLGSSLSGNSGRRGMEFTGTATLYKCIGNEASKATVGSVSQAVSNESYSFPNRQYNSLFLSWEDRKTSV